MSTVTRSVIVRLRAEMAQFKKEWNDGTGAVKGTREELAKTSRQAKATGKDLDGTGTTVGKLSKNLRENRSEWDLVGSSLLRTGAVLAATSGLMTKAAIDWESAWAGVTKTVEGTPAQLAAVEEGLRDLAKTMPESHDQIAAVAEAAGQLGVATEDVVDFTRVMVMLGDTTNLSADEAATSIAQLMNVMQTAPDDVNRVGAALVALGNDGASTERDIVQMAQRIAGAGKIVGLTEAQVLSLANALASSGIEVEAGGSSISNVLIDISKAVAAGGDDLEKFAEVAGISADDFANKWKTDPAIALADFTEGLGLMAARGDDVFGTLEALGQTDIRVTRSLLNMANAGTLLRDSLATGDEAWQRNIALVQEAEKRYDTTAAKAQIAWNNIKDNAIDAGQGMLPVVSAVSDVVVTLGNAFGSLPDPVKAGLSVLAGGTGVALLLAGGFLKVVGTARDVRSAFIALDASGSAGARGVGKVAKAAGLATAAMAAFNVASKFRDSDVADVSKFEAGILALAEGGKKARTELSALGESELGGKIDELDGLAAAMLEVKSNSGGLGKVGNELAGFLSFGGFKDQQGLKTLEAYDTALTDLASKGATEDAARGFALMAEKAEAMGIGVDELHEMLPGYSASLQDVANEQTLTARGTEAIGESASEAADEVNDLVKALEGLLDPLIGQEDASNAWKDSIASLTEDLKENGTTLDDNTVKGRANQDAIRERVSALKDSIAADAEAGVGQEELSAKLLRGAENIVKAGVAAGFSERKMRRYLKQLGLTPEQIKTIITANTDAAMHNLRVVNKYLDDMNGRRVKVYVDGGTPGGLLRAEGGPIVGQGGPKQDNILVNASVGEHMWTAAEVANVGGHGAMYQMRAHARAGKRPSFADGGAVDDAWNQSFRSAAAAYGAPVMSVPASSSGGGSGEPQILSVDVTGISVGFDKNNRPVMLGELRAAFATQNRYNKPGKKR